MKSAQPSTLAASDGRGKSVAWDRRNAVLFLVSLLLLAAGAWITLKTTRNWEASLDWVNHTHMVLAELDVAANGLSEAEGSQRGYLLTGNPAFLAQHEAARDQVRSNLTLLRRLVTDSPRQLALLREVEPLVELRLKLMAERIEDRRSGRTSMAEIPQLERGMKLSAQIRKIRQDMEAVEKEVLSMRQTELKEHVREATWIVGFVACLSAGILTLLFLLMWRENLARRRAEADARAMRDQAEAASRVKSQFLANMSHEIRTPMNGIMGITELLGGTSLSETQRTYLGVMRSSSEALLRLINDILDLSKIEAGHLTMEEAPFSLRQTIERAVGSVAPRAQAKGLELACDLPAMLPDRLRGDSTRLEQVLLNLLGNAVKFTEQGEIVLRVRMEVPAGGAKNRVELHGSVSDTGVGVAAGQLETIFEAFQQADSSTTRRFGGTGLGLAITRELVTRMNGRIWAESVKGKGSTFHFVITLRTDDATETALPMGGELQGLRALVIDDNATQCQLLAEVLRSWRMDPVAVQDAGAALEAVRRVRTVGGTGYGLVLVDARLVSEDGFGLVRQLRAEPGFNAKVVMMVPALADEEDYRLSRELADARLNKPITPSRLLDAIMAALSGARATVPEGAAPAAAQAAKARPLRLLLVEDNEVNQVVALGLLRRAGHEVVVAGSGPEAIAKFSPGAFDAVLMDVQMPGMDGFETARRIRVMEEGASRCVWIVAMTAHAMKGDRDHCLAEGMDDYVAKPIDRAELERVLRQVAARAAGKELAGNGPAGGGALHGLAQANEAGRRFFGALSERLGNDERMALETARLLSKDMPSRMAELVAALKADQAEEASLAAHTLKSHVRLIGEVDLGDRLEEIESHARRNELAAAGSLFEVQRETLQETARALKAFGPVQQRQE